MHLLGHRVSLVLTGEMATRDIPETEDFQDNRYEGQSGNVFTQARSQFDSQQLPSLYLLILYPKTDLENAQVQFIITLNTVWVPIILVLQD